MNTAYQLTPFQQHTPPPGGRGIGVSTPVSSHGRGVSRGGTDIVDAVGLESIRQAFKMLGEKEALSIPEPVGRAIRALVNETLEDLPDGEGIPAQVN